MATEVIITNSNETYYVTVNGRATFEHAPQLRSLAKTLEETTFTAINVDLGKCGGMDSTFMGILAMLGLRARKINAPMAIYNAGDMNRNLLFGLGLKKLFEFKEGIMGSQGEATRIEQEKSATENAQTVLDAHKTLMDADEQNVPRFEKVVELVQKDIDKLNKPE